MTDDHILAGRERLRVWRERAGIEADRAIREGLLKEGFGAGLPSHVTESDMDAIVVYERTPDDWSCDVLFRDSDGCRAFRIGTPDYERHPTKRDAEKAGFLILISLLAVLRTRETP